MKTSNAEFQETKNSRKYPSGAREERGEQHGMQNHGCNVMYLECLEVAARCGLNTCHNVSLGLDSWPSFNAGTSPRHGWTAGRDRVEKARQ